MRNMQVKVLLFVFLFHSFVKRRFCPVTEEIFDIFSSKLNFEDGHKLYLFFKADALIAILCNTMQIMAITASSIQQVVHTPVIFKR